MSENSANQRKKRWVHLDTVLKNGEGQEIPRVEKIPPSAWSDNMRFWPPVEYKNIFNYYVLSEGVDGEAMENYKSMEAYQFFQAFKVGTVLFHEPSPSLCYLKADVTPSQSVHSSKHQAWVLVKDTGVIETAGCSCIAGQGKTCSHAGAILWKLEYAATTGRSGMACTDQQQQWNKGTTRNLEPHRLQDINFKKKKRTSELQDTVCAQDSMPKLPAYLTSDELQTAVQQSSIAKLWTFGMAGKVLAAKLNQPNLKVLEHTTHSPDHVSCNFCRTFFNKYIVLTNDQTKKLEEETRGQSTSDLWREARRLRVTASTAKKVPVRQQTNPDNFLREQTYPSFRGNASTRHGQLSESLALQQLKTMGMDLSSSCHGMYVSTAEPWLSASPDGITADGTVIEVKCPVMKDGETLPDKVKDGVCDLYMMQNNKPHLKENGGRGYYKQVQLTMFCTGHHKCSFFVWTENHHLLIGVEYNEQYVLKEIEKLRKFYFLHMLPRLATDFQEGRLKFSSGYRRLCSQ